MILLLGMCCRRLVKYQVKIDGVRCTNAGHTDGGQQSASVSDVSFARGQWNDLDVRERSYQSHNKLLATRLVQPNNRCR